MKKSADSCNSSTQKTGDITNWELSRWSVLLSIRRRNTWLGYLRCDWETWRPRLCCGVLSGEVTAEQTDSARDAFAVDLAKGNELRPYITKQFVF